MSRDITSESATTQARMFREGDVSCEELVTSCLARIGAHDDAIGAFVTVRNEDAIAEARAIDKHRSNNASEFCGIPIAISDLLDTAGIRTTYSTRSRADAVPEADANCVRRVRDAGCIVIGKTNVSELGCYSTTESHLNGVCRNPWNVRHTAGGPCGGAAAAVAAGFCSISLGVNGGGSLGTPASCCGVVGFGPSRACARDLHPLAPQTGQSFRGQWRTRKPSRRFLEATAEGSRLPHPTEPP